MRSLAAQCVGEPSLGYPRWEQQKYADKQEIATTHDARLSPTRSSWQRSGADPCRTFLEHHPAMRSCSRTIQDQILAGQCGLHHQSANNQDTPQQRSRQLLAQKHM